MIKSFIAGRSPRSVSTSSTTARVGLFALRYTLILRTRCARLRWTAPQVLQSLTHVRSAHCRVFLFYKNSCRFVSKNAVFMIFCYTSPMTIKRRLFISNIVMILVPAAVAAFVALVAAVAFWRVVYVQYMDESLEDGRLLFSAGNETDDFRRIENKFSGLFSSSSSFEDSGDSSSSVASDLMPDSTVNTENEAFSLNINGIFFVREPLSVRGENYSILIFGSFDWNEDEGNEAVFKLVLAAVVILVFAAVFATNSFLTRFIVKKIQSPLEILERGVKNISDGNLSYRINYSGDDEFLPICKAFNSMAARLAELSEAQKKDEKNPGAS